MEASLAGEKQEDPHQVKQHFFMEIDHEIFSMIFCPFWWFKLGSWQFLVKECSQVLVNFLED